jgi:hypothetical protein
MLDTEAGSVSSSDTSSESIRSSDSSRSDYRRRPRRDNGVVFPREENQVQPEGQAGLLGQVAQAEGQPQAAQQIEPEVPVAVPNKNNFHIERFKISREKSKKLRNLVKFGLTGVKAKTLYNRFCPKFKKGKFDLCIPEMDDSIYSELEVMKESAASKEKIDKGEADWRSITRFWIWFVPCFSFGRKVTIRAVEPQSRRQFV